MYARRAEVLPSGDRSGRFHGPGLPQGKSCQDLRGLRPGVEDSRAIINGRPEPARGPADGPGRDASALADSIGFGNVFPYMGNIDPSRARRMAAFGPSCPDKCSSQSLMTTASELRSGKTHRDENFRVASWIIHPRHRALILAFYNFVRTADDIADHATLAASDKLAYLDLLEAELLGKGDSQPEAVNLRRALAER